MKGDPDVIELLNRVLTAELTAINQYFVHSKMCANWGYARLADHHRNESIEEMKHADQLMDRILMLDGVPNMQRLNPVKVGETVPEQHQLDLELELTAQKVLNDGIALCRDKGDNVSRELLERILMDEEEGIDWIEAQLHQIDEMGLQNYLTEQVRGG
ncbi:MAG: bacterioferritin [Acidobacteriota bacterium]